MASSGKKKTTMAKLDRERRMREKRMDKQARKDARKYLAANPEAEQDGGGADLEHDEATGSAAREPAGVAGPR
jgi:hypothetical protein